MDDVAAAKEAAEHLVRTVAEAVRKRLPGLPDGIISCQVRNRVLG